VEAALYAVTLSAAASKSMGESGVRVLGRGEDGREWVECLKVLLEGVPLKAASCLGGGREPTGVSRIQVSLTSGDPGGPKMKGEGDWRVLDGAGTSKTSESKVSVIKIVGGSGEGTKND